MNNLDASHAAQHQKMTQTPIPRLVLSLAVPTIISMLVTSVYNMADTFFVSKLGTSASGAVGVVFSLMAIIQAVGFTLGMGAGSWISRLLGAKNPDKATQVASSGFFASLLFGLLLALFGLIFLDPFMLLLGASDTILPYAKSYAQYILLAAPVMSASFVLNNILRAEGKARFAMVGIAGGGILNILLDPLFIFGLNLGTVGAAIATAISQLISFFILLSSFLRGKTGTRLAFQKISRELSDYLQILKNGLPSFCRQGLASISSVALNQSAVIYGDAAVAAMAIVGKIFMFIFSVGLGIAQGYQPVLGYNYGARQYERVKDSFFFTLKAGILVMTLSGALCFLFASNLITAFISDDPEVIRIGTLALRAQCLALPFLPFGVVCNMTFQSIGESWTATFLSAARQGIFFLPLILLLPRWIGLLGVQFTQPAADLLTFVCCFPFAIRFFKKLSRMERAEERR